MGWYFRRSVKFGPLRLNLSKSGVGYSVGVKGLRVGTGPRGSYVAGGRYGLYYRQYLKSAGADKQNAAILGSPPTQPLPAYCTHCGAPIIPGNLFCTECGARLEDSTEVNVFEPERPIHWPKALLLVIAALIVIRVATLLLDRSSPASPPSPNSMQEIAPSLPTIPVVKRGAPIQPGPERVMSIVLRDCGKPSQIRQDGKIMIWEYARRGYNLNWALPVSDDEKASHDGGPWLLTVQDRKNGTLHDANERAMVLQEMPCIKAALSTANTPKSKRIR